ncbi:DUF4387 family protein [Paracoccus pantotrophus]|uniref:DUF4387 domain-containing protein n=1 Tax=Paracoccus pantotrophus TaxID=82367 RepID=Q3S8E7_PARPN|nr:MULTISPECIES: DUF4387 family protein [Paracoccus]AAZ93598.1 conserved hypothetical protein [Paracoccus pantotrophus]RDD96934.1 DUF4387 family protein [Paracoccus pantotrophus]WGR66593.1 DUF4387 family protein [Paracoccus pantotrophus]
MKLAEMVKVLRSKNAGPCQLTLDLIFDRVEHFDAVAARIEDLRGEVARRYGVALEAVSAHQSAAAMAIKFTLPRRVISGSFGDSDVYGAQQNGPLMAVEL